MKATIRIVYIGGQSGLIPCPQPCTTLPSCHQSDCYSLTQGIVLLLMDWPLMELGTANLTTPKSFSTTPYTVPWRLWDLKLTTFSQRSSSAGRVPVLSSRPTPHPVFTSWRSDFNLTRPQHKTLLATLRTGFWWFSSGSALSATFVEDWHAMTS